VAGEQMLDECGDAFVFVAVELRVFEERKVPGTSNSPYFVEYAKGALVELIELFAGGLRKHGRELYKF
jgi:hypothetical protein